MSRATSDRSENIFGTDGIRDRGGEGWLAPAGLTRLAQAIVAFAGRRGHSAPRVLIGRDPRASGPEIEAVLTKAPLASGRAAGPTVLHAGLVPTPAVSLLVEEGIADIGIVISASHNPPEFNGVKLFGPEGRKLTVEEEFAISADAFDAKPFDLVALDDVDIEVDPSLRERYLDRLFADFGGAPFLSGLQIVLDCARGATAGCATEVFRRAGADVHAIHDTPDGERINLGCGSTHPEAIAGAVLAAGADLGIAFDGDGDRAILVDATGQVVDGDEMLTLWALDLAAREELPGKRIAVTVMSNSGMESYLDEQGISLVRTQVGDREVHQAMLEEGLALGGEQSGHIIEGSAATGDGIRTGLALARLVKRSGKTLAELRQPIPRFPQTLIGVEISRKPAFDSLPELRDLLAEAERALAGHGRVLLRYSGTEPLARILVEGANAAENEEWAERIGRVFREHSVFHATELVAEE